LAILLRKIFCLAKVTQLLFSKNALGGRNVRTGAHVLSAFFYVLSRRKKEDTFFLNFSFRLVKQYFRSVGQSYFNEIYHLSKAKLSYIEFFNKNSSTSQLTTGT